jgi:MoaE-MoaD fusion protein
VHVSVRVFGGLVQAVGGPRVDVEVADGARVDDVLDAVAATNPGIVPMLPAVKVAVNLEVVARDTVLSGSEQVALLPPVAGGSDDGPVTLTGLREPPFDVDDVVAKVGGPSVGGTAVFLGTVRDHAPDLDGVVTLEYSAYPEMAEKVLADTADAIGRDHPEVTGIALLHAVGALPVGAHTVLIVCAAAHRSAAFDACRDALERVKDHVPVWKREITADGADRWVGLPDTDTPSRRTS